MREHTVNAIADHRATRAALRPFGTKHEVIDSELRAAFKEIRERLLSGGRIEYIVFLDADPRQRLALGGERVAEVGQLLFFLEQRLARRQPFSRRCDARTFQRGSGHDCFSFIFESGLRLRKPAMRRTLVSTSATTPPLEVMPTANVAALAMQTGHMVSSSFAARANACGLIRRVAPRARGCTSSRPSHCDQLRRAGQIHCGGT